MLAKIVTRSLNPFVPPADPDLATAIVHQRAAVLALEREVSEARDALARADAEVAVVVRQRDVPIWELARLGELSAEGR